MKYIFPGFPWSRVMSNQTSSEYSNEYIAKNRYGIPDNDEIQNCSSVAFLIHSYGFSLGNILVCGYGICLAAKHVQVLLRQRIICSLLFLTTLSAICVASFLLIDPYGLKGRLPCILLGILWKLADVVVPWNFVLIHMFVSEQTRLNISNFELGNRNLLWICCILESVAVFTTEIISSLNLVSFSLTVISDAIFSIFVFFLMSFFIYGAPRLSNYIREMKKARKSFSEFNVSKKFELTYSQSGDSYQKRLQFPKIRRSEHSLRKISLTSISCSSLIDEQFKTNQENVCTAVLAPAQRPTKLDILPSTIDRNKKRFNNNVKDKTNLKSIDSSSEGSIYSIKSVREVTESNRVKKLPIEVGPENIVKSKEMYSTESGPFSSIKADDFDAQIDSENAVDVSIENSSHKQPGCTTYEQGYLADSECISNWSNDTKSETNSMGIIQIPEVKTSLPVSTSFVSLYRIRQQRMLQRMLKVCYLQAFSLGLLLTCKVYIMFSEYGGLFHTRNLKPVTWLVFQSFQRTVELVVGLVYIIGVHVYTSSKSSCQAKNRYKKDNR